MKERIPAWLLNIVVVLPWAVWLVIKAKAELKQTIRRRRWMKRYGRIK